jgi:hypothetical protein
VKVVCTSCKRLKKKSTVYIEETHWNRDYFDEEGNEHRGRAWYDFKCSNGHSFTRMEPKK